MIKQPQPAPFRLYDNPIAGRERAGDLIRHFHRYELRRPESRGQAAAFAGYHADPAARAVAYSVPDATQEMQRASDRRGVIAILDAGARHEMVGEPRAS